MFEPIFKEFNRLIGEMDLLDLPPDYFCQMFEETSARRTYAEFQLKTHLTWQTNKSVTAAIGTWLYN